MLVDNGHISSMTKFLIMPVNYGLFVKYPITEKIKTSIIIIIITDWTDDCKVHQLMVTWGHDSPLDDQHWVIIRPLIGQHRAISLVIRETGDWTVKW